MSETPKAIGSLAKKPSDVTRQGTQKLKFAPVLPARRKKEEVKQEEQPATPVAAGPSERGRGRGRGDRGRGEGGAGRGRGRGAAPVVEMTASGPFAMGPSLAGASGRRSTPRSNFVPSVPQLGKNSQLTGTATPTLKREAGKLGAETIKVEDDEVYSDPDEGVEIIDMDRVKALDWLAPETLKKETKKRRIVKKEEPTDETVDQTVAAGEATEDEEEFEDMIHDFQTQFDLTDAEGETEDRLFFFRFPEPFPKFVSNKPVEAPMDVEATLPVTPATATAVKKVSFAADLDTPTQSTSATPAPSEPLKPEPIDGVIGQLEVYRSGAVKMRLANGILLDVGTATQPSFLQQAVYRDPTEHNLIVLGEVNKQYIVSPNVDALLVALEQSEARAKTIGQAEGLIKMDTS